MLDLIQQISTIFSRVSSEPTANWAEDFARNRLIPILEHLPFVPEGVAEHFPVSLGTILVMFGACGIFVAIVPLIPLVLVLAEAQGFRPDSEPDRSHARGSLGYASNAGRRGQVNL